MFRSYRQLASLCIAITVCGAGCRRELAGRPAPEGEIYFPLGLTVSQQDPTILYLMSTDWNQKYNTGWLSTIDLKPVINDGVTTLGDENHVVELKRVNVPALGGELTMSPNGDYLVAAFRANNAIGIFEIDPTDLTASCGDPSNKSGLTADDRRTDCDGRHLYDFTQRGVDQYFLQDQFRSPYGVRFVAKNDPNALDKLVVGFQQSYLSMCLISFLDIDLTASPEIVVGQQSMDLRQNIAGLNVESTAVVATFPDASFGRYIAVGARANQAGITSATIFGVNLDAFNFNAQLTVDDPTDDALNDAQIARIDIRAQAGGFSITDLRFSKSGDRAFASIGYSQPTAGSSDSVVMMDTTLRARQLQLPDAQNLLVQRPEYVVLDTLAVQGTPEGVLYMERVGKSPLLVTATFVDNALHFVRVGPSSLDAVTRLDRRTGDGPMLLAETHFAPAADPANVHDYVLVTAFLNHSLTIFDVTDDNPANWLQYKLESFLPAGERFH